MATLAHKIAKWTTQQTFDALPAEVVHEVKRRVIDSIGCALGAYHSAPATIARAKATRCCSPPESWAGRRSNRRLIFKSFVTS